MAERQQQQRGGTSERRRQQNVIAQRNYRAKQRERLKNLERLVVVAVVGSSDGLTIGATSSRNPPPSASASSASATTSSTTSTAIAGERPTAIASVNEGNDENDLLPTTNTTPASAPPPSSNSLRDPGRRHHSGPRSTDFLAPLLKFTPREAETCLTVIEREGFGFRDVYKYGLISLGYAMDPALFAKSRSLPMREWLSLMWRAADSAASEEEFVKLVFAAGLKLFASFQVSPAATTSNGSTAAGSAASTTNASTIEAPPPPPPPQIPCPSISIALSNLTITNLSVTAAMRANARQLLIHDVDIANEDGQSPMFQQLLSDMPAELSPDLVPTAAQLAIPHHPCFDLVPWPEFRTRALLAISTDPPLADEEDICLDVMNDGLVCWGTTAGSMHGRGQGAPWDRRSWEAAPWFLEKWEALTGGRQGEMWRNSEWWRYMRGQGG